jgi:hypothetical protein
VTPVQAAVSDASGAARLHGRLPGQRARQDRSSRDGGSRVG